MKQNYLFILRQLRVARWRRGWTQKQLGTKMGCSQSLVSNLENGKYDLDAPTYGDWCYTAFEALGQRGRFEMLLAGHDWRQLAGRQEREGVMKDQGLIPLPLFNTLIRKHELFDVNVADRLYWSHGLLIGDAEAVYMLPPEVWRKGQGVCYDRVAVSSAPDWTKQDALDVLVYWRATQQFRVMRSLLRGGAVYLVPIPHGCESANVAPVAAGEHAEIMAHVVAWLPELASDGAMRAGRRYWAATEVATGAARSVPTSSTSS